MRQHPGWLYVPGSLDDQPQHLLEIEDELDRAQSEMHRRGEAS